MRVFISYARVDKPYCIQIVNILNVHEVWYDQRLYAGQQWWKEILRRLDWCEGFIYLLSPEAIKSEYCQREFELAVNLGKHIFPVLIHRETPIPEQLTTYQYADLSQGLTVDAVINLVNSIYAAEQEKFHNQPISLNAVTPEVITPPMIDDANVISRAAAAMEKGEFDQAVFVLRQAKARGYKSRFINLESFLTEAEMALERQTYLREAERDYRQIAELVKHKRTFKLGCEAFEAFARDFPDYDPDGLAAQCARDEHKPPATSIATLHVLKRAAIPGIEWCEIPKGGVKVQDGENGGRVIHVDDFMIAKYPITNAQYQVFIDATDGYRNLDWWNFLPAACEWRQANPQPRGSNFKGDERPRESINWYEAVAFSNWLSNRLEMDIRLPTLIQRRRAIQGDDERIYPWGDQFDRSRCNTREHQLKQTTFVTRFPNGISPFGAYDLAGNVWEWCLDGKQDSQDNPDYPDEALRVVHGGSFVSPHTRCQVSSFYHLQPRTYYASIGFRIACK